jgi:hypothetical protein
MTNMLPRDRAEMIVAQYAAGKSMRAIAEAYGHSLATIRDYVHGRRTPGEPAARDDEFARFAAYCRQRLAGDPHLRTPALLAELRSLGLDGSRATFYRGLERHGIQPHPCPDCYPARISGYAPLPAARQPRPSPLPMPAAPLTGETLTSFLGRLAAANLTTTDDLLKILPPWFRVKTRWHDDRWQHDQLEPRADDAAARLAALSGSASPSGPLPHAVAAQRPAASGSRSRSTCPPGSRPASGTASGYPDREHRSSASAAVPTSWMPNAGHAGSSAATPSSSSSTPGPAHPQDKPDTSTHGNAGPRRSSSQTPVRSLKQAPRHCSRLRLIQTSSPQPRNRYLAHVKWRPPGRRLPLNLSHRSSGQL